MHRTDKNSIICIDEKYWLKVNNLWLKYRAALVGIFWGVLKPNLPLRRRWGNACSSQNSSLKIEAGAFPCPGAMATFSLSIILGVWDTRVASFDAVLCMLRGSSIEANSVSLLTSFTFSVVSFPSELF